MDHEMREWKIDDAIDLRLREGTGTLVCEVSDIGAMLKVFVQMVLFVVNVEVLNISSIFRKFFDWEREWRVEVAFVRAYDHCFK